MLQGRFLSIIKFLSNRIKQKMSLSPEAEPPLFDQLEPSVPVSYPIKTLEELGSRSYFDSFHYPFNIASVPLQWNEYLPDRPRILVCHDMQGGYVDDKWVQGGQNDSGYPIWHWYLMDVFIYFSHSLVTLPPPGWTNTAHRHGVKVLGTFITEWDEGRATSNTLLATRESAEKYADRLAELAVALGFDGWLINMEVELDKDQIPNLKEFVSHLTRVMHLSKPGSLVIWYDSVTIDGKLKWQDQLNGSNKPFFDVCDGIFMNYRWKENYPKLSADVAGDRKYDVYMGIDIFGRGSYGGGEWNTNVALDVIKRNNVSAALFAPGWIYETKQPPDFQTAQNRWWALVEKSWGIVQTYPKFLPFYSNFDQGHGCHTSFQGQEVSDAPWYNISSQGLQPLLQFTDEPTLDAIQVFIDFKEASYDGGGNIVFKGTLEENAHFTTKLFQADLLLGDSPLHITYSVKSEGNSLLGLLLHFSSSMNEEKSVLLASSRTSHFLSKFSNVIVPRQVKSSPEVAFGWVVEESFIMPNERKLTEIHALCYKPETDTNSSPSEYFAVLGHLAITTSEQNSEFPPSSLWLTEGQYIKWTSGPQDSKILSAKLAWELKEGTDSLISKYIIYVEKLEKQGSRKLAENVKRNPEFLGVAQVKAYYISKLVIPPATTSLKFIIQACAADGSYQKVDHSPFFQLDIEDQ